MSAELSDRLFDGGLPVYLIATPREQLLTCEPHERIDDVNRRAQQYDNIPVEKDGVIIGTLTRDGMRPGKTVERCVTPLSERHLIGAETPIMDFVRGQESAEARFIIDRGGVSGLVTLSDLQKLPARAALFGLITQLELEMGEAVQELFPNDGWIDRLRPEDRTELQTNIERAKKRDVFTRAIDLTQLREKYFLLQNLFALGPWADFRPVNDLRNGLAHAKPYIHDRRDERRLVKTVRHVDELFGRVARRDPG